MKPILHIFRPPRKIVFIIGGVLLLGGATGAFALYLSKDHFLTSKSDVGNGLACTTVKTVKVQKKDRLWIRKFIKTESTDGLARVQTALRVAKAVYNSQKPDLVQVVVLDQKGPEQRADMRGRAVGADVVYVPHPEKLVDLAGTPVFSAKYVDGAPNDGGQFYGEKIQVPPADIDRLIASLDDSSDCSDPVVAGAKAASEHGKPAATEGHGATPAAEGHDAAPATEAHGETPAADGHGETPAAEEHGDAPAEGHGETSSAEPEPEPAAAEHDTAELTPSHAAPTEEAAAAPAEEPVETH